MHKFTILFLIGIFHSSTLYFILYFLTERQLLQDKKEILELFRLWKKEYDEKLRILSMSDNEYTKYIRNINEIKTYN